MRAREFTAEASLSSGIFKYEDQRNRVPIFLKKLKDKSPFSVRDKTGIIQVIFDPAQYDQIQTHLANKNKRFALKVFGSDKTIPFSHIIKTKEFGGEEAGRRENIEQQQINDIANQLEQAKNGSNSISLTVGDRLVDAAQVIKTPDFVNGRAPKSDMTILNSVGDHVAWVSLKGRPFRWGGWSHLMNVPKIANWLNKIKAETTSTGGAFGPKNSYGLHIDDDVIPLIVYGKNFSTGKRGISNVDTVLVGDPVIKKTKDGNFLLTASTEYKNGEIPSGGDKPHLVLRYMLGRNDAGFKNARAETNTGSEGRKVKWLDSDTPATNTTSSTQIVQTPTEPQPANDLERLTDLAGIKPTN